MRLTAEQLAFEASAPVSLVDELVAAGAIHRRADGTHERGDIARVRLAHALASGGIGVDDLMHEIRTGNMPFSEIPRGIVFTPRPTGRTFADFEATLGERAALLPSVYSALGLGLPPPERAMHEDEEAAISGFLQVWGLVADEPEMFVRAARIMGEGVRHIVVATFDLLDEFEGSPPQRMRRGLSVEEAIAPSAQQPTMMDAVLVWLRERHSEREVFGRIVAFTERSLARAGRLPPRPEDPPAIAFVDLAGYTERTSKAGDEIAASDAARLQELAQESARQHGGRVVKLLGDGVMLSFRRTRPAVAAVRDLMRAIAERGLPPAHAGIAAGPVVTRDGDVYGHTVNLASRLSAEAGPGEILVTREATDWMGPDVLWEDHGELVLKGIELPVAVALVAD